MHFSWIRDTRRANAAAVNLVRSALRQLQQQRSLPHAEHSEQRAPRIEICDFPSCDSIEEALRALSRHAAEGTETREAVGIITSRRAAEDYDPEHPERIACILVKHGSGDDRSMFFVVTNDRQIDVERIVRFWINAPAESFSESNMECVVCMRSLLPSSVKKGKGKGKGKRREPRVGISHTRCFACYSPICVSCMEELNVEERSLCYRCPVCRAWFLGDGSFGVPWTPTPQDSSSSTSDDKRIATREQLSHEHIDERFGGDGIDVLCDRVLPHLDGEVTIIPRVNDEFLVDDTFVVSKLSRTNRYYDSNERGMSDRIPHVRRALKRICDDVIAERGLSVEHSGGGEICIAVVDIWLRRRTFAIDAEQERPVEEATVMRLRCLPKRISASTTTSATIAYDRELLQLHSDAWTDVWGALTRATLEDDGVKHIPFITRKVAYLPPHDFVYPRSIRDAIAALAHDIDGAEVMTVALIVPNGRSGSRGMGVNYDARGESFTASVHDVGGGSLASPGDPLTVHERFLATRFSACQDYAVSIGVGELFLTVRFIYADRNDADAAVLSYSVTDGAVARLPPDIGRAIIDSDIDGLLVSRAVTRVF